MYVQVVEKVCKITTVRIVGMFRNDGALVVGNSSSVRHHRELYCHSGGA